MRHTGIYISFGSNSEPESSIIAAVRLLTRDVDVMASSTVYEVPASGRLDGPPSYHGVLRLETQIEPWPLKFEVLKPLEEELARTNSAGGVGPRAIHLDILLYGELAIETVGLTVPDPRVLTRAHLAVPLHELAGDIPLPGTGVWLGHIAVAIDRGSLRPLVAFTKRLKDEVERGYRQGSVGGG